MLLLLLVLRQYEEEEEEKHTSRTNQFNSILSFSTLRYVRYDSTLFERIQQIAR